MTTQNTFINSYNKTNCPELVLNFTKDAYFLIDKNLVLQYFNPIAAMAVKAKYSKQLYEGMSILDLAPPERHADLKKLYLRVLSGKDERTEASFTLPDETIVCYENLFTPAYDTEGNVLGIVIRSTNISEKKQTVALIQEAEERWRFALDASNQAAWDWNMQTNEVIYSGSYKRLYGFERDELKNNLSDWEQRIHPEDRKRMEGAIEEHIASDNPYYESTYRLQVKNGDYKWIMARGKLLSKDSEGNPLRMIGTHTDLTESIKMQLDLKTMAERFTYAAKASAQALWEWNPVTGKAYVSQSFTELFGWAADPDHRFEQWHSYIHPDDKKQTVSNYYTALEKPDATIWQAEYRFQKQDGAYATVSDRAYILRDDTGKAIKVIGATQDITALKKTEEELYRSNQRFDNMMMATHDLLWDWDVQAGQIYRSGKGLPKIYSLNNDDANRKIDQWMERVHPDDRPKLDRIFSNMPSALHQETFEVEYRFRKEDGMYAHICDRGIFLKDDEGKPLRVIGAAQDISQRKQLEEELLTNELEYKKLINQATVDSQEQERGEIGKELHDNINQVLTTTKLYLELALSNDAMMKELVTKTSKTISSVISEIRQLSRSLMDPTIGDLGIVESINDLIENINITKKICVTLHIDNRIEGLLNKKQNLTLYRIIQESLNNIIKHAMAVEAEVNISVHEDRVKLVISDDGIGFEQESIKKGAGLKNITNRVYLINGALKIDTAPGKGCIIFINFPVKKPANT